MNKIILTQVNKDKIHSTHKLSFEQRDIKSENILLTKEKQIRFIDLRTVRDMNDPTFEGSGNGRKSNQNIQLSDNIILKICGNSIIYGS
ncbi:unnamed protein product [Paramecium primaurelia]|uniref:Protein kinase domain-containing protein n=1 Tax=Paramecium primaurelia TaxID=5886 RepID=A0A8S1MZQ5_PARPR|nr:unnamed protein product [Paramecium primaurelia]